MIDKHFILATAGHVDHGKSTLVKALTGTDPDRLPEEKARGITIDLGFAELNLAGPHGETFHVGIVDVPGHEDFVRNMIAGVGSIDLALLVVAADDGWMPQTEEHVQILEYLGVRRAVIALTKIDTGNANRVEAQIHEQLRGTAFAGASLVRTSLRRANLTALSSQVSEAGIAELKSALASEFAMLSPPRDIGKSRLFVDRAFALRGIGTIVTGTLTGGPLQRGQNVFIQPGNWQTRVRSIQSHGRDLEMAQPGTRTALNLSDVSVGRNGIERGNVVTTIDLGRTTDSIAVLLERSWRPNRNSSAARLIKNRSCAYLHFGTSRVGATITLLDTDAIHCGQRAVAYLRLNSPIFAFVGGRFVVRDSSEQNTIAGGVVLDVDVRPEDFRNPKEVEFLRARAAAPDDVDLCICSQLVRDCFTETNALLVESNFSREEITTALQRLHDSGKVVLRGPIAADPARWRELFVKAAELIDNQHQKHPEKRGIHLADLRARLNIESDQAFDALVTELASNQFVRMETTVARDFHRPSLPPEISRTAEKIRAALAAKPFDPPSRKDLSQDRQLQQVLRFLIEQGEIVEVGEEIVLLRDAVNQMRSLVTEFISSNGSATASQLRQRLESSRRIIIPFLEYLDRTGVTRRVGDQRVLAQKATVAKLDDAAIARRS
jgi:selenocysteine-specific elongation factor